MKGVISGVLQALRRECMQHAKRSTTQANIERIKAEIAAVDAESHQLTARIDVRGQIGACVALTCISHATEIAVNPGSQTCGHCGSFSCKVHCESRLLTGCIELHRAEERGSRSFCSTWTSCNGRWKRRTAATVPRLCKSDERTAKLNRNRAAA